MSSWSSSFLSPQKTIGHPELCVHDSLAFLYVFICISLSLTRIFSRHVSGLYTVEYPSSVTLFLATSGPEKHHFGCSCELSSAAAALSPISMLMLSPIAIELFSLFWGCFLFLLFQTFLLCYILDMSLTQHLLWK